MYLSTYLPNVDSKSLQLKNIFNKNVTFFYVNPARMWQGQFDPDHKTEVLKWLVPM